MSLEFAKAYNVTNLVEQEKQKLLSYQDAGYVAIYIALDVHDMQVYRILEDYNEEYEKESGTYLVEREKISKYDVVDKLLEINNRSEDYVASRELRDIMLDSFSEKDILICTLLIDDNNGLENWDNIECDSLEEAKNIIDGGYGLIEELL